jgi:hypothetical protein
MTTNMNNEYTFTTEAIAAEEGEFEVYLEYPTPAPVGYKPRPSGYYQIEQQLSARDFSWYKKKQNP